MLLSFVNPQVMEDVAFHPCVRFARYEQDRCAAFAPEDACVLGVTALSKRLLDIVE